MPKQRVVILMGSKKDLSFIEPICRILKQFGINFDRRIASAHKTPRKVLEILEKYKRGKEKIVYITVAGMANALSGFVDASTESPVIACPPLSEKFSTVDIYSSLRVPSGVAPLVILEPENAALAAAKILAIGDADLSEKIVRYQGEMKKKIDEDDRELQRGSMK